MESKPMRYALMLLLVLASAACAEDKPRPHTALPSVHVLEPMAMPGLDRSRIVRVYLPPSYDTAAEKRYPVIYMHDGQNLFDDATSYVGEWGVDETMDALAKETGFEAIVVGIDHGAEKRINELGPWTNERFGKSEGEPYMKFVVDVVKPYVDTHYRSKPGREDTAVMGSSMGGLMSHYAILKYPAVFSKAGVLSPAYWVNPEITAYTREHPASSDARIYLYAGGKEGAEMVDGFRAMAQELRKMGSGQLEARLVEENNHNETAWRGEFPLVVKWLFDVKAK